LKEARQRVIAMDVFRGFTVILMIFVDNAGAAFPEVDHCPWDGMHLADLVVPFFDFLVGMSLPYALRKFQSPKEALWHAGPRFLRLFLLGIATQCGVGFMQYNMSRLRIMGILQRVAVCYLVAVLAEVLLPHDEMPPPPRDAMEAARESLIENEEAQEGEVQAATWWEPFWSYRCHMLLCVGLLALHSLVLYGVKVPDSQGARFNLTCGRGVLTPVCNGASFVDQLVLGFPHMYFPSNGGGLGADVTFQRLSECSGCSPGKCLMPPGETPQPWCLSTYTDNGAGGGPYLGGAAFDPEGLVSSLTCVIASLMGLHYTHVLQRAQRGGYSPLPEWIGPGLAQLALGLSLHLSGAMLMNTDLYSIPFLLVSNGITALMMSLCYFTCDVVRGAAASVAEPFRVVGMNAIAIYVLAEAGPLQWFLSCFYLELNNGHPATENHLGNVLWPTGVFWPDASLPTAAAGATHDWRVMVWTLTYIALFCCLAYYWDRKGIYIVI